MRSTIDREWMLTKSWCWLRVNADGERMLRATADWVWMLTESGCWLRANADWEWMLTESEYRQRLDADWEWMLTESEYWQRLDADWEWILTESEWCFVKEHRILALLLLLYSFYLYFLIPFNQTVATACSFSDAAMFPASFLKFLRFLYGQWSFYNF